jgi:diguanylate cyclase (GGDEF)-like protein
MTAQVVCFDVDRVRRQRIVEVVREVGAEPLESATGTVFGLVRRASVAIAAGEAGLDVLARLALDRPQLARIAIVDAGASAEELFQLVDRIHPFSLLPDPFDADRLGAILRDALAGAVETQQASDLTQRIVRPIAAADFALMVSDRLTGADGYHYVRLRLEDELERAERYGRPLSLVLVDVDDLGAINDRWGRAVGDLVLRQVAATLKSGARAVDRVGRWAGGTFALVLPETAPGVAYGMVERLRTDILARRILTPPSSSEPSMPPRLRLTVSCGLASTVKDGTSHPQSLIARADAALARAKQAGRNRTVHDGSP